MRRSELPAAVAPLMSKCPWGSWKWQWGVKEMPSSFPCSPVIPECSWKKTQIEKNNILIYLLCSLQYIDTNQVTANTVKDCLLYHPLQYEKEVPASRGLLETYFITIRYLRKEVTYGNKYTREEQLELFKNNIREHLYFIYNVAKIQQTENDFFRIWEKIITREGVINIPQGVVTTWKLSLQPCLPPLKTE